MAVPLMYVLSDVELHFFPNCISYGLIEGSHFELKRECVCMLPALFKLYIVFITLLHE
jgi:hypothetical protein